MAALVCEVLERGDDPAWQRVALTISPGVSALQAAAARAGAPLGHDFCAISLSDLLTPWSAIERRLEAAAAADFVTVLYNPASRRRRQGLARALAVLGAARDPATPVVHARNLGRDGESVEVAEPRGVRARRGRHAEPPDRRRAPHPLPARGRAAAALVYTPRGYGALPAALP